jgi:hypothetical protein
MERNAFKAAGFVLVMGLTLLSPASTSGQESSPERSTNVNQVLEWNQIFVDMLIATNTANSSSQRLGAIVHTAIFDAYNGIEQRYTPIFVHNRAPRSASRRAAVIAAAHTALVGLFPSQKPTLDASYEASLATLGAQGQGGGRSVDRGIEWGTEVGLRVLAWRAVDGFGIDYSPFTGGTAIGQWRPTPPTNGPMSAQGLAFTDTFILFNNTQFRPRPPRSLMDPKYTSDYNSVKSLGRRTGSSRTEDQTALAAFWEGNASVHWNQAANQIARARHMSISDTNRLLAVLNIAMADTAIQTGCRSSTRRCTLNTLPGTPVRMAPLRRFSSVTLARSRPSR